MLGRISAMGKKCMSCPINYFASCWPPFFPWQPSLLGNTGRWLLKLRAGWPNPCARVREISEAPKPYGGRGGVKVAPSIFLLLFPPPPSFPAWAPNDTYVIRPEWIFCASYTQTALVPQPSLVGGGSIAHAAILLALPVVPRPIGGRRGDGKEGMDKF
ncbi:hypothetical protein V2G26_006232 [Clonostachys chloroleuca]